MPALINIIDIFSSFSGYKINFNKSEALPLGAFSNINDLPNFPFRWSVEGFCYLGIHVPANLNRLLHLNVTSVVKKIKKIKEDLDRWMDLPISWTGWIG